MANIGKTAIGIQIALNELEQIGDPVKNTRLLGEVHINGVYCHIEAIQVIRNREQEQVGVDEAGEQNLAEASAAFTPDGGFNTIEWEGREYVLFVYPGS
jgi:hypothetical protein